MNHKEQLLQKIRSRKARIGVMENIFRSVNIVLVNELKTVFDRMGIDVRKVIEAAKSKPFGSMPHYVVDKTVKAFVEMGRSIKGAKVLLLGLSYRADIDDDRESPGDELIDLFGELGADWAYCDPFIAQARIGRKNKRKMSSVPCTRGWFGKHDVLVVATAHGAFKEATLHGKTPFVVDAGNIV